MKNSFIIGRQYGYRKNAQRAINQFIRRNFPLIVRGKQFWVNQIDDGCFEICSN